MNDSQLQNWLGVMRDPKSGKCKDQLQDVTNSNDRCCLGHLGFSLDVIIETKLNDNREAFIVYRYGHDWPSSSNLPRALAKELDMTQNGDFVKDVKIRGTRYACMSEVNDETDLTISEIADVIEAQFKANNVARYEP